VIDGSHRFDCVKPAVSALRGGGAIILDNSDWASETVRLLRSAGLTQVDFIGPGAINPYVWATSAFLSDGGSRLPHRDRLHVVGGIDQRGASDRPGA
jgi:hypothetical protein